MSQTVATSLFYYFSLYSNLSVFIRKIQNLEAGKDTWKNSLITSFGKITGAMKGPEKWQKVVEQKW